MKKVNVIIMVAVVAIALFSCNAQKNASQKQVSMLVEDHLTTTYNFPSGTYYQFEFPEGTRSDFDEMTIINKIIDAKLPVRSVWYKPQSSSCTPPGSDKSMMVIVSPAMLVQMMSDNEDIVKLGFTKVNRPSMGGCAYHVKHYFLMK